MLVPGASAAARRSHDPGVLELFIQIPPLAPKDKTEILFHLPYNWGKKGECPILASQQINHSANGKLRSNAEMSNSDFNSLQLTENRSRSRTQLELTKCPSRLWKISMKVGGVSSRSTLFVPDQVSKNTRNIFFPMLCLASLPQEEEHNLTWSNLIQDDEPFLPSTRKKRKIILSLITGKKLDESKSKRPTEVKVGLRLNRRVVMEEVKNLSIAKSSNGRKRKHSTRQAENQRHQQKTLQCPESRTIEEIDAALNSHFNLSAKHGSIVVYEMGGSNLSPFSIDSDEIIATLLKYNQKKPHQKKPRRIAFSDARSSIETLNTLSGGSQSTQKCNAPHFACVPLEDGQLRTFCLTTGNMAGKAVHRLVCEAIQQETGRRCTVCWSCEGSGKEGVQECIKCGLSAHPSCCYSKGSLSIASIDSENSMNCPLGSPNDINSAALHSNAKSQITAIDYQWQCAVCCHFSETKPRRNPRTPPHFSVEETCVLLNGNGDNNANVPGPRCSLCPHRGGAMSLLESSDDSVQSPRWAHEVCRIWSDFNICGESNMDEYSSLSRPPRRSPTSRSVCALCGTGGSKGNNSMRVNAGLTRCAAFGCSVVFHPMCALLSRLSPEMCMDVQGSEYKPARTRRTRHTKQQRKEEKGSIIDENIEADKKICKEYTLQMVQLTRAEQGVGSANKEENTTIIPVAFCGIHNHRRKDSFYGRLPGGAVI